MEWADSRDSWVARWESQCQLRCLHGMYLCYSAEPQTKISNRIPHYKETNISGIDEFGGKLHSGSNGIIRLLVKALHTENKASRCEAYQALRRLSWPRAVWLMQIVESDRLFYNELASRCYAFAAHWRGAVALLVEARSMLLQGGEDNFFRASKTCVRAGHWEQTWLGLWGVFMQNFLFSQSSSCW